MKSLKKWVALLTAAALVTSSSYASAQDFYEGGGDRGYSEYRGAPDSTPGLVAGAVALALIIGLLFQGNDHHHGHTHF